MKTSPSIKSFQKKGNTLNTKIGPQGVAEVVSYSFYHADPSRQHPQGCLVLSVNLNIGQVNEGKLQTHLQSLLVHKYHLPSRSITLGFGTKSFCAMGPLTMDEDGLLIIIQDATCHLGLPECTWITTWQAVKRPKTSRPESPAPVKKPIIFLYEPPKETAILWLGIPTPQEQAA